MTYATRSAAHPHCTSAMATVVDPGPRIDRHGDLLHLPHEDRPHKGHHEESQVAQNLLAGVSHGTYVECFGDPERAVLAGDVGEPATPRDSMVTVSDAPGFGPGWTRR